MLFARKGFVRQAICSGAPIVLIATVGGHDTVDVVDDPTESAPPAQTAQDRLTSAVAEVLRPLLAKCDFAANPPPRVQIPPPPSQHFDRPVAQR